MRTAFKDAAKAFGILILWIGCLELGLQFSRALLEGSIIMRQWPRAFHLRPGAHEWIEFEGANWVHINSLGFEDIERSLQRKPGVLRIAVLGSSPVQAAQVPPQQAFPAMIERALRSCRRSKAGDVEVLNFGVGGYGLPQQWMMLRDEIWDYDPQIVIEAVGLYNDIVNSDRYTTVSGYIYPYFTVENGQLIPDEITRAQRPPDPRWVSVENRLRDIENLFKLPLLVEKFKAQMLPPWQPGLKVDPKQISTFSPPRDSHLENAWKVSETALRLMHEECLAHGAEFWVVPLDFNIQSYPDPLVRYARLRELRIADPHYPDKRIMEFAQKQGMHSFWLAPLVAEYAEKHGVALHGFYNTPVNFGHYNLLGHQVLGGLIADALCQGSERLRAAQPQ